MIKPFDNIVLKSPVNFQARVTVDVDTAAERVILMHRGRGDVYYVFKPIMQITHFIVPFNHTSADTLLVGILDNDRIYNCEFTDGLRAELIDGNHHG